jgi:hypothetical protein
MQQMGPEGPVQIARLWIEAVVEDRDLGKAWPFTHPRFRTELAAAWVDANRAHPDLAKREHVELERVLAAPASDDFLWPGFEATTLGEFHDYWLFLDLGSWGWLSDPRPHGPDRELVYLVDLNGPAVKETDGRYEVTEDAEVLVTGFVMELMGDRDADGVDIFLGGEVQNRWRVIDLTRRAEEPSI